MRKKLSGTLIEIDFRHNLMNVQNRTMSTTKESKSINTEMSTVEIYKY